MEGEVHHRVGDRPRDAAAVTLKVLFVSGSLPGIRCGVGDYTARLASELARRPDISVSVLTGTNERVRLDAAFPAQVVPGARWGLGRLPSLLQMLRKVAPDVVHVQYPTVGYDSRLGIVFLPLVSRLLGRVPTVLTIHERRERRWPARFAIDFMALSSTEVVTLDPVESKSLKSAMRQISSKVLTGRMISTIPVAANVNRQAWRTRLHAEDGDIVIVTFGLIHPRRRLEEIIGAVAELRRLKVPVRLVVVGGEAEYDPDAARVYARSLREKALELGLDGVISWMDHVDVDVVSACLQAADVAVLLYSDGASGRNTTLRAALEHGLPVVTTGGAATSDSLRQEAGLLFVSAADYTAADLAQAVMQALKMSSTGKRVPTDDSNLKEQVDFHLDLYKRILRGQAPHQRSNASINGVQL
jgi:glycosyltransferase involved in cell wall biosynthesis